MKDPTITTLPRPARLSSGPKPGHNGTIRFTPRELDIIRLAALGKGQKAIAVELGIAARTTSVHLRRIYDRIGIAGRGAGPRLTAWALANGFGGSYGE